MAWKFFEEMNMAHNGVSLAQGRQVLQLLEEMKVPSARLTHLIKDKILPMLLETDSREIDFSTFKQSLGMIEPPLVRRVASTKKSIADLLSEMRASVRGNRAELLSYEADERKPIANHLVLLSDEYIFGRNADCSEEEILRRVAQRGFRLADPFQCLEFARQHQEDISFPVAALSFSLEENWLLTAGWMKGKYDVYFSSPIQDVVPELVDGRKLLCEFL